MFASCFWLFFKNLIGHYIAYSYIGKINALPYIKKRKAPGKWEKNKRHPTVMAKKALPLSGLVSAAASASIVALGIIYGGYLADCRVQPESPSHFASELGDV